MNSRSKLVLLVVMLVQSVSFAMTEASYLRRHEKDGFIALQTTARKFVAPDKPAIGVVGVIHIGTQAYYTHLQRFLNACTSVYFEGIRPTDAPPSPTNDEYKTRRHEPATGLQADLAKNLGLVFQLNAIDCEQPNFYNVDTSLPMLLKAFQEKQVDDKIIKVLTEGKLSFTEALLFDLFGKLMAIDSLQHTMRYVIISAFSDNQILSLLLKQEPVIMEILLTQRNVYIFDYLKKDLSSNRYTAKDSIALFYGAAHAHGLEALIRKLGYQSAPHNTEYPAVYHFDAFSAQVNQIVAQESIDQALHDLVKKRQHETTHTPIQQ